MAGMPKFHSRGHVTQRRCIVSGQDLSRLGVSDKKESVAWPGGLCTVVLVL